MGPDGQEGQEGQEGMDEHPTATDASAEPRKEDICGHAWPEAKAGPDAEVEGERAVEHSQDAASLSMDAKLRVPPVMDLQYQHMGKGHASTPCLIKSTE